MVLLDNGSMAPQFVLPNQDGHNIRLADYEGKNILLWWYPKADTPGWTIEGEGFRDRTQLFKAKDCEIFGISLDSTNDNKAFKDKFGFPFDLLSDEGGAVSSLYGAAEAGANKAGRISVLIGSDGRVVKVYSPVKPSEHPDEVLQDLT